MLCEFCTIVQSYVIYGESPHEFIRTVQDWTRLNKIATQGKGPYDKWTRKPLAYRESKMFCNPPSWDTCNPPSWDMYNPPSWDMSTLFWNIFTLLAVTQSVDNLFHSFIVLCENECFLISNLHGSFTNVTSCPLVLLSFLSEKKYWYQFFHDLLLTFLSLELLNHILSGVLHN